MIEDVTARHLWYSMEAHTLAAPLLLSRDYPWQILSHLCDFIRAVGEALPADEYEHILPSVWVARTARLAENVHIDGPTILGHDTELRPGAYIRGGVLVGDGCVVGNSTELKNTILFDGVQVPHFNYVGDSIIGHRSHMGAGAVTSNLKSDKSPVTVMYNGQRIETGIKKFGAILADNVEIGCGSVLNPGTVIGSRTNVYPLSSVRGYVRADSIFKSQDNIVKKRTADPRAYK